MLEGAALDGADDLVGDGEDGVVGEAGHQFVGAGLGFGPAAEGDGLGDDAGEVLAALFIRGDVLDAGPADFGGGGEVLDVAGARRHDAVGGEQHDAGEVGEFLLLVLPRGAEVALEVGVLLQLGIAERGEHFAVGVDVDALAGGLFEQHLQVVQVVAGDDDEGALFQRGGHLGRDGVAVGAGVGGVEQGHAGEVDLAEFHDETEPAFDGVVVAEGLQALLEPGGDGGIGLAEDAGVVGVGRHAAQAEEEGGAQGDDVFIAVEEIFGAVGVRAAGGDGRAQDAVAHGGQVLGIEIDVGDGHEQRVHEERLDLGVGGLAVDGAGEGDHRRGDVVLQVGRFGGLAANAHLGAAFAAGGLFALETEHAHGLLLVGFFFKGYQGSGFREQKERPKNYFSQRFSEVHGEGYWKHSLWFSVNLRERNGCGFQSSRIWPSVEIVTTCQGMVLPEAWRARWTAEAMPPQQGTSMRRTVTLLISLVWRMAESFSA